MPSPLSAASAAVSAAAEELEPLLMGRSGISDGSGGSGGNAASSLPTQSARPPSSAADSTTSTTPATLSRRMMRTTHAASSATPSYSALGDATLAPPLVVGGAAHAPDGDDASDNDSSDWRSSRDALIVNMAAPGTPPSAPSAPRGVGGRGSSGILGFPLAVYFIIGNEFCERFTYYGIKVIMFVYLTSPFFNLNRDNATAVIHGFTSLAYFFPLVGAFIADGWLGRYMTIKYLSFVYCVGSLVLCGLAMSNTFFPIPLRLTFVFFGLVLLAIGTGGIKPCVAAFGADQISELQQPARAEPARDRLPLTATDDRSQSADNGNSERIDAHRQQPFSQNCDDNDNDDNDNDDDAAELCSMLSSSESSADSRDVEPASTPDGDNRISLFFSSFYFAINAGSLLSMIITPIVKGQKCWGADTCYPLAFGLPAALMLTSTLIFVAGRRCYRAAGPPSPGQNAIAKVFRVLRAGFRSRRSAIAAGGWYRPRHWLDYATYDVGNDQRHGRPAGGATRSAGRDGGLLSSNEETNERVSRADVEDVKRLLQLLTVFLPLPVFWALYDQMGSRWVDQAQQLDLGVYFRDREKPLFSVYPEQLGVINTVLVLSLIPVSRMLYRHVSISLRARMTIGMILAAMSFISASMLQASIDGMKESSIKKVYPSPANLNTAGVLSPETKVSFIYQLPQYVLITMAEIFFSISGIEFAYEHSPPSMRSVCQAAWNLTVSFGNILVVFITEFVKIPPFWEFRLYTIVLLIATAVFQMLSVRLDRQQLRRPLQN